MEGVVSKIFYYFEWSADLIAKIIDITRVGIGLNLNMSFDYVAHFEVLGWIDIRVMMLTMASVAFFYKYF